MTQKELKMVLEYKGLDNGELKKNTSEIQWPRCLKIIPPLTACVLRSLVRVLLWARSFPFIFAKSTIYVVLTKCWQLPISFMVSQFKYK